MRLTCDSSTWLCMHQVTQEYAPPEHEERHGARLGTPLRDDGLAEVDADPMEPPHVEKRSSSGVPGPSTGSKRDTASGSVTQPTVSIPAVIPACSLSQSIL